MAFTVPEINEQVAIVEKAAPDLRMPPRMPPYEDARRTFKWEQAERDIDWFSGGRLNIAQNVVDRHAAGRLAHKVALHWESAEGKHEAYTFQQLSMLSNKFANALASQGIIKGDRVFIFMPRVPELYTAFLGTLKLGAIDGTLFSAFGGDALYDRLSDSGAKVVVTVPALLDRVREIREKLPDLERVIVVDRGRPVELHEGELSWPALMKDASIYFATVPMDPEDHAFMLYTSGTTGKSKGVLHAHRAVVQEHITTKWVLDVREEDIYWCTADPGWVTGISYGIIGPWSNGVTSLVYEGRYEADVWYRLIDKYRVTVWYTAPTAIRMLMRDDDDVVKQFDLKSLRHMCSVGEPLNPEAIRWGLRAFGLPFHDNWWQTETGSILIANYPSMDIKLGSMGKPFPGIEATIIDDEGRELPPGNPGNLAIKPGWPSMMRGIWGNLKKYRDYFKTGWYTTGDKAYVDEDGYFWFIGRADDVIMTAGERVGPFEVESVLVEHPAVAEAGVIGKPDALRGEIIKAFVSLSTGYEESDELREEIKNHVKDRLAGHAYPREIEFVDTLPKTQSGKIMRRVLKARELGLPVGDLATMEQD